ncbi:MAG: hypothetical protein NZ699_13590 [Roseiflexus sp.]|nr:hypothetical protein [Roseiflexus sp.]MCS7290157.1 hypothetical protein [Roseiflexus sp.]MDW8148766.1 hypothetical protein [Roseiflexaceae bacterium]MDW8232620.1 hypothetical protein [Roseiflexaceae bacterium]
MLATSDIPQADVLWHVARVPEAIMRGHTTYEAIGAYLGAKGQRQGLYYAQAARVLGLVGEPEEDGTVPLTPYGRAFAQYDRFAQGAALRRLLREQEPTRSVLRAMREHGGLDYDGIAAVLRRLAPLAASTARRRAHTAAAWLVAAGLASWRDGKLVAVSALPESMGWAVARWRAGSAAR